MELATTGSDKISDKFCRDHRESFVTNGLAHDAVMCAFWLYVAITKAVSTARDIVSHW